MKIKKSILNTFLCAIVFSSLIYSFACQRKIDPGKWEVLFPNATWNKFSKQEEKDFVGTIKFAPKNPRPSFVQRFNPYKLVMQSGETFDIYCSGSNVLKPYIGRRVIVRGKRMDLEIEGYLFKEIWPIGIKCLE
jgi:hypothetical protein